jgi:hypothetical protein
MSLQDLKEKNVIDSTKEIDQKQLACSNPWNSITAIYRN